jgi:S1-C subfamily serine protease
MLSLEELHSRILYPVVRVRLEKSGGSGTVIYSQPTRGAKAGTEHQTFVLTNHHVIEDALKIDEKWDSLLQRRTKQEVRGKVAVDLFDYVDLSTCVSSNTHMADIVAYSPEQDLALLKLVSPKRVEHVASLFPRGEEDHIKMFTEIYSCGASLLHEPFANKGRITYLQEIIDNETYWMNSANSIFGNSGGAVFLADTGEFIGVPARVTTKQMGFGVDIITWMSYAIPIPRIYNFLEDQEMQFVYDEKETFEAGLKRREKKQKKASYDVMANEDEGMGKKEVEEPTPFPFGNPGGN